MKNNSSLLAQVNAGFRPMKKVLPLRFFIVAAALLVSGAILTERHLALGLGLVVCSLLVAIPVVLISLQRVDAYEKQYLEGLSQDELMVLVGKDMSYQSKFSTSLVLQVLDRRFPTWRQPSST